PLLTSPAPLCLCHTGAVHRLGQAADELLLLLQQGTPLLSPQRDAGAFRAWTKDAETVVSACRQINDRVPRMRARAQSCGLPTALLWPQENETRIEIDRLFGRLAASALGLASAGEGCSWVLDALRRRMEYNLELLFGSKRLPKIPPAVTPTPHAEVLE